mgnify:CR=1 FL=1
MIKAQLYYYNNADLLECPVWDPKKGILYCIEIRKNRVYAINPTDRSCRSYDCGSTVGWIYLKRDGNLFAAKKDGIFELNVDTGAFTYLIHAEPDVRMRYNDGVLDRKGRILVGTKGDKGKMEGQGALWSCENNGDVRKLIPGCTVSNGVCFSHDGNTLYHIDSPTLEVCAYKYDINTGNISDRRVVTKIEGGGEPDGMCIDRDGMLWVAEHMGSKVCRWTPEGNLLEIVAVPCLGATSCCIGGENMDTLFVTTMRTKGVFEPLAGGLFSAKVFN